MIESCVRLILDVRQTSMPITVNTKRGDTSRKLLITLTDGGIPCSIGTDCYAAFTAKKPDGTVLFNECAMENGEICYVFTEQTCSVAGSIPAEIRIYGNDSRLITSACFTLAVHDTVFHEDDVVSSDEMNALDALVLETEALKNEIQRKLDNGEFVGEPGTGVNILGSFDSREELIASHPTGNIGDGYMINGQLHVWSGSTGEWNNVGNIQGPKGESAYDYAKAGGYKGTEAEFMQKLAAEYLSKAGGELTGELKMSGKPISGLNMPTEEDQAANMGFVNKQMRKASPRNLLDNSNFTNLVAQAGIGGYHGTVAYAADRWILTDGTVSYTAGVGLTLNGTITQKLEWWPSNSKSFVECASGTATIKRSNGTVTITSSGGVLKNAACYPGSYTDDEKPNYCPKGYSEELRECKRYYWKVQYAACHGFAFSSQTVYAFWSLPVSMKATPAFVMSDDFKIAVRHNGNQYIVGKADITQIDWYDYYARFRIRQGSMGIPVDTPVMSNIYAGTVEINADLL